jgi:DNA-3-methyladenine glycosylase I
MNKCDWCIGDPAYEDYHDHVWGKPVYDDQELFEFLTLEGAQAGLSWISILRRKEGYKEAFDNYDLEKIIAYSDEKIESLMQNEKIIRNRLKIKSVIKNAGAFKQVQEEFGSFSRYMWSYVNHEPVLNQPKSIADVPSETVLSNTISKDLKKRGFSFVGPTIVYAYMQAIGMVNDHISTCFLYKEHL